MINLNLVHKAKKVINSNYVLDAFIDNNLTNILDLKKELLCVMGKWDSRDILPYFEDASDVHNEYRIIEDILLQKESFNPKKTYTPSMYFVRTTVAKQVFNELSSLINGKRTKIKYLACAKSTGKTFSQNVWLKENDQLLENEKIFWRRCDCKKLIDLYKKHIQSGNITTVENSIQRYLDIQFLYILAKHYGSEERPFFDQIYNELKDAQFIPRISGNHRDRKNGDAVLILNELQAYKNEIDRYKKDYSRHYGRDVVIEEAINKDIIYTKNIDNWTRLSEEIQRILKNKGYKFLNIIDSIDNYKKYNSEGNKTFYYAFLLNQLSKYTLEYIEKGEKKEFTIIFGRKNTFYNYWEEINAAKDCFNLRNEVDVTFMDANSIEDKRKIFNRRLEFLLEKFPDSEILKIFNVIINYKIKETSPLYQFVSSDKHIGYLIRNQYNFIPSIFYFLRKYKLGDDKVSPYIETQISANLLLNGYFSLNTSSRPEEKGQILFNIFYYNIKKTTEGIWHGLCTTRILQCLQHIEDISKIDLIDEIHRLFRYNKEEIMRKIAKLMNYALIKYTDGKDESFDNPTIQLTDKGRNTLTFVYSDIDLLYHCSIDTPLPSRLRAESILQPHDNKFEKKNYAISVLKSSISFIQFLKMVDKEELAYIKKLDMTDVERSAYELPLYNDEISGYLDERIKNLISSLNETAIDDFDHFLHKFKPEITL